MLPSRLYESPGYPRGAAQPPHVAEGSDVVRRKNETCRKFRGPPSMKCGIEWDEWTMVRALVRPEHTVLELGARFGTTSCALAAATNNSGRVVAVEPDPAALPYLLDNRRRQQCNFAVLHGAIGTRPILFGQSAGDGYGTQTAPAPSRRTRTPRIVPTNLSDIEAAIGSRVDTLLIDCEGCIAHALSSELLRRLRLVLWEEDGPSAVDNRRWYRRLVAYGFQLHWRIRDTFDPRQTWSRHAVHSAWLRPSAAGGRAVLPPTCPEYKAAHHLDDAALRCTNSHLQNGTKLAVERGVHGAHLRVPAPPCP